MRIRESIEKELYDNPGLVENRSDRLSRMQIELLLDIRDSNQEVKNELQTIRLRNSNGQGK